ncbi:hypothetical protein GCM10009117_04390 [Gangjinia marincola]|uniref:DUF4920 domain-containing protein n=1 Tax=Gangjinia marincola TaxID=578463 RepID=A0ABN1MDY9_9FLAO
MKRIISILIVVLLFSACNEKVENEKTSSNQEKEIAQVDYESFGESFNAKNFKSMKEVSTMYEDLQKGDSTTVKFKATVNEVCQKKGCWITVGEDSLMIRFKDYGFFMPKDIAGEDAIINGVAYWEETDVETLRHYAEDAGKSPEEIAAITTPKMEKKFLAQGVLLTK